MEWWKSEFWYSTIPFHYYLAIPFLLFNVLTFNPLTFCKILPNFRLRSALRHNNNKSYF